MPNQKEIGDHLRGAAYYSGWLLISFQKPLPGITELSLLLLNAPPANAMNSRQRDV